MKTKLLPSIEGYLEMIAWENGDVEFVAHVGTIVVPVQTLVKPSIAEVEGILALLRFLDEEGWGFYGLGPYHDQMIVLARYDESSEDTWYGTPIPGTGGLEYMFINHNFCVEV